MAVATLSRIKIGVQELLFLLGLTVIAFSIVGAVWQSQADRAEIASQPALPRPAP